MHVCVYILIISSFEVVFLNGTSVKYNNVIKLIKWKSFGSVHFHQKPALYKQETGISQLMF